MDEAGTPTTEHPLGRALLIASAVFGAAYLIDGLGVEAPYPIDVVIKAAGIVLLAVYAGLHRRWLLAAGLALGAAGDVFLALQPSQVAAGIASFGLGHLVYVALFIGVWRREGRGGNAGAIAAVALAVFGVVMLILLQPHFGELRVAASVYNAVIIVMACLALIARSPKLAWIGALLFVASDTILALRMFAHVLPWAGPVVWISYYLGQAGIALGLSRDEPRAG